MNQPGRTQGRSTRALSFVIAVGLTSSLAVASPPESTKSGENPVEMGAISWMKGFDTAALRARREKKLVLILFQEIPGCSTCTGYGRDVLSHPLIKDAAETLFVPVCVRNNTQGDEDARVLAHFKEPAWNNPVVRIVTPDKKPVGDRVSGDYTVGGLAHAMVAALKTGRRPVPTYLELLAEESAARRRGLERATFAMHCFWEGEAALGSIDGVISTEPGYLAGREVVEVEFDPRTVNYVKLLDAAMSRKCASTAFTRSDAQQKAADGVLGGDAIRTDEKTRPDREPKYFLSRTPYRFVPMTELQAARVNSAIHLGGEPKSFLSPSQIQLLEKAQRSPADKRPVMIGRSDLVKAWKAATGGPDKK